MKILHLADLHIGKSLCGYSLLEDQEEIFESICAEARAQAPDAVLIAGDVFDRSVPSEGAIALYERFISELSETAPVYMISGNHDSGVRLELFNTILEKRGIYISGTPELPLKPFVLEAGGETAHIYLLPYISPSAARSLSEGDSFEETIVSLLEEIELDEDAINILVTHQFFTNSKQDLEELPEGSERTVVGGLDDIGAGILERFDYAALGHIHRSCAVRGDRIRYAGSPLKYSVNESKKFLNFVELDKERVQVDRVELESRRDVREIAGTFEELARPEMGTDDYVSIRLKSQSGIMNVKGRLLEFYPNLLNIIYDYSERPQSEAEITRKVKEERPIELLESFFTSKGFTLEEGQRELAEKILENI